MVFGNHRYEIFTRIKYSYLINFTVGYTILSPSTDSLCVTEISRGDKANTSLLYTLYQVM